VVTVSRPGQFEHELSGRESSHDEPALGEGRQRRGLLAPLLPGLGQDGVHDAVSQPVGEAGQGARLAEDGDGGAGRAPAHDGDVCTGPRQAASPRQHCAGPQRVA